MKKIVVVSAGLGVPSSTRLLADMLSNAVERALKEREVEVSIETIELRPLAHALADNLLTGFPSEELRQAYASIAAADAVIAVSPVFSASYSGLFKMFFDGLELGSLDGTPMIVAATAGTARHSLVLDHALRPLFSYLHADVLSTGVFAASEDFGNTANGALDDRIERAAAQLAQRLSGPHQLQPKRQLVEAKFANPTDFTELLAAASRG
ncbi:MAG TPA: FMN reductase [Marmoricola sp.]|nr:FMN reductase [Marmoricola sp.]